jgi:hypothetical protein
LNTKCQSYWETRYRDGGCSGGGSIGAIRDWKWSMIRKYASVNDVIDVGCGDLSFWEGKSCEKYSGIDISPYIIESNREKRPSWRFICASGSDPLKLEGDVVLCLDVLFHIMDETIYINLLNNLAVYAQKYIFIYTWHKNPFDNFGLWLSILCSLLKHGKIVPLLSSLLGDMASDFEYQKYRSFDDYSFIFEKRGFEQIAVETNEIDPLSALYIFKKL